MAAIILIVLIPFLIIVRGQSEPGLNGEALQVTQDGATKVASSVVSDGVDIFFNETKAGNTRSPRLKHWRTNKAVPYDRSYATAGRNNARPVLVAGSEQRCLVIRPCTRFL